MDRHGLAESGPRLGVRRHPVGRVGGPADATRKRLTRILRTRVNAANEILVAAAPTWPEWRRGGGER